MPDVTEAPEKVTTGSSRTGTPTLPTSEEFTKKTIELNNDLFDEDPISLTDDGEIREVSGTPPEEKKKEVVETEEPQEEKITKAIKEGFERIAPKPEPVKEEPVKLTPEQEDELLNRFKPTEDLLAKFDSDDKQVRLQALFEMRDGIVKQALTMAKYVIDNNAEAIRSEFAPLRDTEQKSKVEAGRKAFYDAYPALNNEAYTDILRLTTEELKAENFQPTSHEEAITTLATRAEAKLKKLIPTFSLGSVQAKTTKTTESKTTIPKQPVTSSGGGGGAASETPEQKPSNRTTGAEVFD